MSPPANPEKPPLESAKRMTDVDYSPGEIDRRLREVGALWESWQALKKWQPRNMSDDDVPYPILVPRN